MQGCVKQLFNWVTLFLCNRFVHCYSVLNALIIFRWMMILTSLLICSPLGGIDKMWLVWIVVWFKSATVCQSNSFWKQGEFICKTLLGLLPLKKNVVITDESKETIVHFWTFSLFALGPAISLLLSKLFLGLKICQENVPRASSGKFSDCTLLWCKLSASCWNTFRQYLLSCLAFKTKTFLFVVLLWYFLYFLIYTLLDFFFSFFFNLCSQAGEQKKFL